MSRIRRAKTRPLRITTIGNTGAGKTTLLQRYNNAHSSAGSSLPRAPAPTLGIDFSVKHVDGTLVELWDTSGQERFYAFSAQYIRCASACALVYDASHPGVECLQQVNDWYDRAMDCRSDFVHVPLVVVGNKKDLMKGAEEVSEVEKWCEAHSIPHFYTHATAHPDDESSQQLCCRPFEDLVSRAMEYRRVSEALDSSGIILEGTTRRHEPSQLCSGC